MSWESLAAVWACCGGVGSGAIVDVVVVLGGGL